MLLFGTKEIEIKIENLLNGVFFVLVLFLTLYTFSIQYNR